MLSEAFLNVSLPLSKELMMPNLMSTDTGSELSLDRCLEYFTAPEKLADPVDCPTCGKKTPTKKQHTISKLPRVLCIHLKRFDAALNKKIDDFVAFPARELNMGPYLPVSFVEGSGILSSCFWCSNIVFLALLHTPL
jgi:ubiquitin C-terminal hydrolase